MNVSTSSNLGKSDPKSPPQKEEDIDKPWSIHEDYRYAPERPEGDLWRKLLDPLMQKEKIRCDAWKEEVGNLLIFAGLFSAVVTAFIIESYRNLQPDPNNDIIDLLSQISGQLTSLGSRGQLLNVSSLPSQSFSPSRSVIRVNIFWFLSPIVSLTTVLVGIVALQWLREHQSYPGQSAREIFAIYHMRSEGMEKWHVWKILTSLPLLLQTSVVLFFAGVIDFLNDFGDRVVVISVATVIGITFSFLIATTTLPAIKTYFLHIRLLFPQRLKTPPVQCPYKSPQSRIFYAVSDICLRILQFCLSTVSSQCRQFLPTSKSLCRQFLGHRRFGTIEQISTSIFKPLKPNYHVRSHLFTLWSTKNWMEFDLAWLWVRDASPRCKEICDSEVFFDLIPLLDIMVALRKATSDFEENFKSDAINEAYYCFSDLSRNFTIRNKAKGDANWPWQPDLPILVRCNQYLQRSFQAHFGSLNVDDQTIEAIDNGLSDVTPDADVSKFLHDRNICIFLDRLQSKSHDIVIHRHEVAIRLQNYLLGRQPTTPSTDPNSAIPDYAREYQFMIPSEEYRWQRPSKPHLSSLPYRLLYRPYLDIDPDIFERDGYSHLGKLPFLRQHLHIVKGFFHYASINEDDQGRAGDSGNIMSLEYLLKYPGFALFLERVGREIAFWHNETRYQPRKEAQDYIRAMKAIIDLIDDIKNKIEVVPERWRLSENNIYLLYCATLLLRPIVSRYKDRPVSSHATALAVVIRAYKAQTIDKEGPNLKIEDCYNNDELRRRLRPHWGDPFSRFSPRWWSFLEAFDSPIATSSASMAQNYIVLPSTYFRGDVSDAEHPVTQPLVPGRMRDSSPLVVGPDVPLVGDNDPQLAPPTLDGDVSMEELMLTYLASSKIPAIDDSQERDYNTMADHDDVASTIATRGSLETDDTSIAELVSDPSTIHTGGSLELDHTSEENMDDPSSSTTAVEMIEEVDFTTRHIPWRSRDSSFITYLATSRAPVGDNGAEIPLQEESMLKYLASSPFPDGVSLRVDEDNSSMDTADDMSLLTMVTSGSLKADTTIVHTDDPSFEVNHTIMESIDELLSSMLVAGVSPKLNRDTVHVDDALSFNMLATQHTPGNYLSVDSLDKSRMDPNAHDLV